MGDDTGETIEDESNSETDKKSEENCVIDPSPDEYLNTEVFIWGIKDWQIIDQLLTSAEVRFIAISRELDRRRDGTAARLRQAVEDAFNAKAQNEKPALGSSGEFTSDRKPIKSKPITSSRRTSKQTRAGVRKSRG